MTSEYRIDELKLHAVIAANSKPSIELIIDFIMIRNNRVKQRRRKGANNSQKMNISLSGTDWEVVFDPVKFNTFYGHFTMTFYGGMG
jgi:hypothetical protein